MSPSAEAGRPSFSRSYGVILPSSFAIVLSITVGIFIQPTCVSFGTDTISHTFPESFLGTSSDLHALNGLSLFRRLCTSLKHASPLSSRRYTTPIFVDPSFRLLTLQWLTIVYAMSIHYPFRARVRLRLTLGGITFPRKP